MENVMANIRKVMSKILSVASAVLLSFMTVLVLWQVFTRYVLDNPAAFQKLIADGTAELTYVDSVYRCSPGILYKRSYGFDFGKR